MMFKYPFLTKRSGAMLLSALSVALVSNTAMATTESVDAGVEFVAPVTLTEVNALEFGLVDVNLANGDTIAIGTDDTITESTTRVLNPSAGTNQMAAEVTVAGTAAKNITILIDTISPGSGYTLGSFICSYNGGADTACDSAMAVTSVTSAALLVGATLTGDGTASAGTADGTFVVNVTYD